MSTQKATAAPPKKAAPGRVNVMREKVVESVRLRVRKLMDTKNNNVAALELYKLRWSYGSVVAARIVDEVIYEYGVNLRERYEKWQAPIKVKPVPPGATIGQFLAEVSKTAPGPGEPDRYFGPDILPYIHTHKLEPWIWVASEGTCWLFEAPLAPGWTLREGIVGDSLQVPPNGRDKRAIEAQRRWPVSLGKQPSNSAIIKAVKSMANVSVRDNGLIALLNHPVATFSGGIRVTWEEVKQWVYDAHICSDLLNKCTRQETLVIKPNPHSSNGLLLYAYEPERWEPAMIRHGLWAAPTLNAADKHKRITPTKAAKRELPPERYDVSYSAVKDEAFGHLHAAAKADRKAEDWNTPAHSAQLQRAFAVEKRDLVRGMLSELRSIAKPTHADSLEIEIWKRFAVQLGSQEIKPDPTQAELAFAALRGTTKSIGRALKKKLAHQAGDVLPDGTMVADPASALLELVDQANPLPVATKPTPPKEKASQVVITNASTAKTLTELAAPFGHDRRQREVIKKRFRSMHGKLANMDAEERRAFINYINTIFP